MSSNVDGQATSDPQAERILRIDPKQPYTRTSIVLTSPESTQPILPSAVSQASYLAQYCVPLESELLHQVTLFKSHLRSIRSGPEFWCSLAKGLTNLLGAQYTCISKRLDTLESNTGVPSLDEEGSCILALAWYYNCSESRVGIYEDVKYTGFCAPCGLMRHNSTVLIPTGLVQTFPTNPNDVFVDTPDAYLGVPMFDGGGVNVGHICLLWSKEGREVCPYSWTTMEFVLHVFVEMATQRFLENIDGHAAFEKEDDLAKAAINSVRREVDLTPTSATELGSPKFVGLPQHNPSMFLPFPAAIAANISHEFRTPLQGIIGLLELLYAQLDSTQSQSYAAISPPPSGGDESQSQLAIKTLLDGIQENSNRLVDFADKLGEYYSIATEAPAFELSPVPSQKRKFIREDTDEEIVWATGGAQRKFLKRRKLGSISTTEADDSSSDNRPSISGMPRSMKATNPTCCQVSIRSTIRQIVKHVLTRHEVAALWGGKKLGLMSRNPETRMRSVLLGEEEKSLLLEWNVADDVPRWLYCGKIGLQKAIAQLLVNAIKFTPTGRITLQVTRQSVKLSPTMSSKEIVLFSIKDTGIGVEDQDQQFLAQPFFQIDPSTTRSREGSGLGLLLTHRWALKVGGELRLESSCTVADDPRRGSEFSLRLPIDKYVPLPNNPDADESDEELTEPTAFESASSNSKTQKKQCKDLATAGNAYDSRLASLYPLKIMVVEDNEILRRVMAQLLQKLGYKSSQLVLCCNGQEAVDYFRARAPKDFDIDLILMDCWMPIMDGIDATRLILDMFPQGMKKYPGVKPDIVAITADNLPANLVKTQNSGMRGYMVKPIKLNDLQRVVEEYAEGNWIMKKLAA